MRFMKQDRPRLRNGRRLKLLVTAVTAALVLAAPGIVLARGLSDIFTDVPNTNQFHDDIGAIARAGVTTGCGASVYCPNDNVTREAMAAFMHRGFGRVTRRTIGGFTLAAGYITVGAESITVGLPPGSLAGAAGFVQADGYLQLHTVNATGCPCILEAFTNLDGLPMTSLTSITTIPAGGDTWAMLPITGVRAVTTSGVHTVNLNARASGTSSWTANAELVASYFPFGGTGTNVLGQASSATPGSGPGTAPGR